MAAKVFFGVLGLCLCFIAVYAGVRVDIIRAYGKFCFFQIWTRAWEHCEAEKKTWLLSRILTQKTKLRILGWVVAYQSRLQILCISYNQPNLVCPAEDALYMTKTDLYKPIFLGMSQQKDDDANVIF